MCSLTFFHGGTYFANMFGHQAFAEMGSHDVYWLDQCDDYCGKIVLCNVSAVHYSFVLMTLLLLLQLCFIRFGAHMGRHNYHYLDKSCLLATSCLSAIFYELTEDFVLDTTSSLVLLLFVCVTSA